MLILLSINLTNIFIVAALIIVLVALCFIARPCIFKKCCKCNEEKINAVEEVQSQEVAVSEAEFAAIAMALHLYYSGGSNVITIKDTYHKYSPWNTKIYGMQ